MTITKARNMVHQASSDHRTTEVQTFVHLFKGYIGPGCLSLPYAFSLLGVLPGIIATVVLCGLTSYNALALVRLKRKLTPDGRDTTYSDIGEIAYGESFRHFVSLSVSAQQLGICTVYFSFVGENIIAVVRRTSGATFPFLENYHVVVTLLLPFALMLTFIPDLRRLAPVMEAATALLMVAFALMGVVVGVNWDDRPEDEASSLGIDWAKAPMAICVILYAYEGINLILPVESAMERPTNFDRTFVVAMVGVCMIFCAFGASCVLAFGSIDDGSITAYLIDNLGRIDYGHGMVVAANAVVSFSVLFTYPLQMFPCIGLFGEWRDRRAHAHHAHAPPPGTVATNDELGGGVGGVRRSTVESGGCREKIGFAPLKTDEDGHHHHQPPLASAAAVLPPPSANPPNYHHPLDNDEGIPRPLCVVAADGDHDEDASGGDAPSDDGGGGEEEETQGWTSSIPGDSIGMRALLVLSTYVVAMVIPNVQELISLVGALAGSLNALVIPPLLELRYVLLPSPSPSSVSTMTQADDEEEETDVETSEDGNGGGVDLDHGRGGGGGGKNVYTSRTAVRCYLLLLVGATCTVGGTIASVTDIVKAFL